MLEMMDDRWYLMGTVGKKIDRECVYEKREKSLYGVEPNNFRSQMKQTSFTVRAGLI